MSKEQLMEIANRLFSHKIESVVYDPPRRDLVYGDITIKFVNGGFLSIAWYGFPFFNKTPKILPESVTFNQSALFFMDETGHQFDVCIDTVKLLFADAPPTPKNLKIRQLSN
jgi:hypothetical protein